MKKHGHVEKVTIIHRQDAPSLSEKKFLSLHHLRLVNTYLNGEVSREYSYDAVLRKWIDAVVMLLVGRVDGRDCVCLRSCIRPPLLLREGLHLPVPESRRYDFLWELPAGLLEPKDTGLDGIRRRAKAEALEETGYLVNMDSFEILPGASFVSPGVIPERLWFVRAVIEDPTSRGAPQGDGSPVEEKAEIWWIPLVEAGRMCDSGEIEDMKTELGLRRLLARANNGQEKP